MTTPFASLNLEKAHIEATRCIQCGFCLPACPTYKVFGEEKHSPRGRIQLVKLWAEGKAEMDDSIQNALDICLDCRACETACPIDVRYGEILAGARDELAARHSGMSDELTWSKTASATDATGSYDTGANIPTGLNGADPQDAQVTTGDRHIRTSEQRSIGAWRPFTRVKDLLFHSILRHIVAVPNRMRFVARGAHFFVHSPPGRWLRRLTARRPDAWMASALIFAQAVPAPPTPKAVRVPQSSGASDRPRAALMLGCAQDGLFPETNDATILLLQQTGYDVVIPEAQGCCGALHRHHGAKPYARSLVRQNMRAFGVYDETPPYDVIVMNAGGCMAWVKEAAELFPPGSEDKAAAVRMAENTQDLSTVLANASFPNRTKSPVPDHGAETSGVTHDQGPKVVYQPSCHLTNVCGVTSEPFDLLKHLSPGTVTLPADGGSCCGSAGIYNVLQPQASAAILKHKMDAIEQCDPDIIITSNPGCHMQMMAGVRSRGLERHVQVKQLAEYLADLDKART